jgi:hypothetical protein
MEGREHMKQYQLCEHIYHAQMDDEIIILDTKNNVYLGVNGIGAKLIRYLLEGTSVETVAEYIAEEYEVEETDFIRDAETFIEDLKRMAIIREHSCNE